MFRRVQVELYDADLLSFGVRMTHELDRAFGLPPKVRGCRACEGQGLAHCQAVQPALRQQLTTCRCWPACIQPAQLHSCLRRSATAPGPQVTASQRDVPGLTRAAVPILAFQGVKAITGGRAAAGWRQGESGVLDWLPN